MKRLFFFLIAIISVNVANAQSSKYVAFPSDSAVWVSNKASASGQGWRSVKWQGQEIINGKTYTKCYSGFDIAINTNFQYAGGVRQDTANEKIYYIGLDSIEHDISVDFHLNIGDKLLISDYFKFAFPISADNPIDTLSVVSIDTTYLNSKSYILKWKTLPYPQTGAKFIFGIGFENVLWFESYSHIECFTIKNTNIIGFSPYCNIYAGINEINTKSENIKISPNPATASIKIEVLHKIKESSLSICNINGQELIRQAMNDSQTMIDISTLCSGLYFVKLITEKTVEVRKIIKE